MLFYNTTLYICEVLTIDCFLLLIAYLLFNARFADTKVRRALVFLILTY